MDYEFINPNILNPSNLKIEIIDEEWVMCHNCFEAWKPLKDFEMTQCKKCKLNYINPYIDKEK